ncbi:hypothetical protein GFJ94_02790 [Flavobacterium sp. LMO8]|uniref:hypothetical protein n=1 Tax=Flavobacterium sp. LMO8 TaxID=2654244 RepID=UPI0012925F90|nr:hypothetical protein [Flavobacterium sp. LMO8]MQP23988.1 hypothetical protein [Flavobacterium sp. LMO8]
MDKKLKKIIQIFILLILPIALYAQKDVTQFLDIPVDGFKPEMIKKLKTKGYTINRYSEDILDGEFNGTDVNIGIATNNNKVWRIAVMDANYTDETNIKIRFNNLIQQFMNNERYVAEPDSIIAKYTIPKEEDISYEITVNKKRYQAVFYQKSVEFDTLTNDEIRKIFKEKDNSETRNAVEELIEGNTENEEIILEIIRKTFNRLNSLNKSVWFMIDEKYGEYRILMFYENEYNKANGSGL